MATSYYQDPFGAADYSAEGMPSLLSLSNLESLGRGSIAGLLGLPEDLRKMLVTKKMQENMDFLSSQSGVPQVPYFLPSSEELKKRTPRMTAPNQLTGLLEDIGSFMSPVPAAAAVKVGKSGLRMAGQEITDVMSGMPSRSLLGDITPQGKLLDVYHGSPYPFPPTERNPLGEFDASKIGTGEGAQAYGYGIYTGGNIKTGKEYAKTTARTEVVDASGNTLYKELPRRKVTGESRALDALDYAFQIQSSNPYAVAAEQVKRFGSGPNVKDALKALEQWEKAGAKTRATEGYLYKADLPDEKIDQMIDWFYPVPEDVRQKVSSAALEKFGSGSTGTSGAHLYTELSKEFERLGSKNPKIDASEFLRQQGVTGIKYLDNFSRRQPEWIIQSPQGGQNIFNSEAGALEFLQKNPDGKMIPPSQTYNYVMFPGEEKNIKILERSDLGGLLD